MPSIDKGSSVRTAAVRLGRRRSDRVREHPADTASFLHVTICRDMLRSIAIHFSPDTAAAGRLSALAAADHDARAKGCRPMTAIATILVLILALGAAIPAASTRALGNTLDDSLWSRRTVLAFVPPTASELDALRAIVSDKGCFVEERDLDIFVIRADAIDALSSNAPSLAGESPDDLRSVYAVDDTRFEMVLIGKDGGIKARSRNPNALTDFFTLIDTMPMRRAEIAERGPTRCASKRDLDANRSKPS